jgi:hypothetical protein
MVTIRLDKAPDSPPAFSDWIGVQDDEPSRRIAK